MTCEEVRGLLDEYIDGELVSERADKVRAHVDACDECRAEHESLQKLEGVLKKAVHEGEGPWDLYTSKVTSRVRREGRWLQGFAAAAAILLVALTLWNLLPSTPAKDTDLHGLLAQYAATTGDERAAIQEKIHALGTEAVPKIVAALKDAPIQAQIGAGQILKTYRDELVTDLLVDMMARIEPVEDSEWILEEIGSEEEDLELVDVAFDDMMNADRDEAFEVLRRLDRSGLNREARMRIVDRLVKLLKMDDPKIQKIGLDLIRELGIEFPLPALVEFLDSPELRDQALEILKKVTGKDYGTDKAAWKKYWASKAGM